MIREREITALPGLPILLALIVAVGGTIWGAVQAAQHENVGLLLGMLLLALL
jgi:hypothetical protein